MNIAPIGYGKMGKLVGSLLRAGSPRPPEAGRIQQHPLRGITRIIPGIDVAIDFSIPDAAVEISGAFPR